jgi:predicted nucleic acid-binding protein
MILVDTGPLVALFDPQHALHERCVKTLKGINPWSLRFLF